MLGFSLKKLLNSFIEINGECERTILGLSSDSRDVKPGDLFIIYIGQDQNWPLYIDDAIQRGAVAVLRDAKDGKTEINFKLFENSKIPVCSISNLSEHVGGIAARFYGEPSHEMTVIGFTGTSGKTSCSQFTARALNSVGISCGIIGTLGHGFPDHLRTSLFTTPNALELQETLAFLRNERAQAVAMEVSSHALAQNRVGGTYFDIGVFTNLSRDHLDYHGDMKNYADAKRKLFSQPGLKHAVINMDDELGENLIAELAGRLNVIGYSTQPKSAKISCVYAKDIKLNHQGMQATVYTPWGEGLLQSSLLGRFNLSNLLATLTVLGLLNIPLTAALKALSRLPTVAGRLQTFGGGKLPLVVVDYAHKPDALEKVLMTLREHCQGKLWCVFGCGGDRDRGKRKLMGEIAERLSDQIVITDDNPRQENPQRIIEDIVEGLVCPWAAEIEHDRQAAIAHAIDCAQGGDIVLIAGKGHETYQIIGTERLPFSDAEHVQTQLKLKEIMLSAHSN